MNYNRYKQPALLWALATEYAAKRWPQRPIGHTDLQLYIYPVDGMGAWLMHNPKLYWQDEVGGQYFGNCDQSALMVADIGEVTLMHRSRKEQQSWVSFEAAVDAMREAQEPRIGRPSLDPVSGPSDTHNIRFPNSLWERIPEPRSEYVRQSVEIRIESGK